MTSFYSALFVALHSPYSQSLLRQFRALYSIYVFLSTCHAVSYRINGVMYILSSFILFIHFLAGNSSFYCSILFQTFLHFKDVSPFRKYFILFPYLLQVFLPDFRPLFFVSVYPRNLLNHCKHLITI
jgi:hypothetical protein